MLELVNDMKFHEEYMIKWKIFDLRIERSIKSLEVIYGKLYFNVRCKELLALFENLKKPTYYYFIGDKKMSYILADGFNLIKGQLQQIKNIRKDASFKLSILSFFRKALYFFLLNLEFLSNDVSSKIDLSLYPYIINSFNEIEIKFDHLIKNLLETYNLNNKYLNSFFCRDYFRAWFKRILKNFINTYKNLIAVPIFEFFNNLEKIDNFIVGDFFDSHIRLQIENSSLFASNFTAVPEQALLDSLFNDLFDWISRKYTSWADFEFNKIKTKMSEMQGKILTLKLTDSLLKVKLVKITKSFDEFFTSDENVQINAFNISFAFSFRMNYEKVVSILRFKEFANPKMKNAMVKFIQTATVSYKSFLVEIEEMNRIYFKMRILKNLSKFVTKIVETYNKKFGDPNKKSDEGEDQDAPVENVDESEAFKKPAELDEVNLPCRYFPYKKKTKQNFAYIKNKWTKKNQNSTV